MTTPERIWAYMYDFQEDDMSWTNDIPTYATFDPRPIEATEYVRADLHDATKAQLAKALDALRFYADPHEIPSEGPWGLHSNDFGSKARAVLAEIEKGEPK